MLACLQPLYWSVHVDRLFAGEDTRTIARAWIVEHVSSGTALALQSYSVPLPQSAESFRESLAANDALGELERAGKYASLLEVAEEEPTSYGLYFLGAGDEPNRIYIGYDALDGGFGPLHERGVQGIVLRHAGVTPPETVVAVFERAAAEGTLLTTIAPGQDGADVTPYLDNEDWAPSSRLEHKGPLIEIWSLAKSSR